MLQRKSHVNYEKTAKEREDQASLTEIGESDGKREAANKTRTILLDTYRTRPARPAIETSHTHASVGVQKATAP